MFIRKCLKCKKDIIYKKRSSFNNATAIGSVCHLCSCDKSARTETSNKLKKILGMSFKDYLNEVECDDGRFIVKCSSCLKQTTVKNKSTVRNSILKKVKCNKCNNRKRHGTYTEFEKHKEIYGAVIAKIKHRSRTKGIKINITLRYIYDIFKKQSFRCNFSGVILNFPKDRSEMLDVDCHNASVDRIDSSKGYVRGNIQIIHKVFQGMKMDMFDEKFFGLCGGVTYFDESTKKQEDVIMSRLLNDDKLMEAVKKRIEELST